MADEYEVRVEGHLDERLRAWFAGLAVRNEPTGETTLRGAIADQAALHGLLARIRDLNLRIVSLTRLEPGDPAEAETERGERQR